MTETMTVAEAVAELRDMLAATEGNHTIAARLARQSLSMLYEFHGADGAVEPYLMKIDEAGWNITPGPVPYDEVDIVIRTEPLTLHRLTNGELGGREAIMSGRLDIRKAPSMPKLLFMRSLFNNHKKALLKSGRGTSGAGKEAAK